MKRNQQQIDYVNTFRDTRLETGLIRRGEDWQVDMIIPHHSAPSPFDPLHIAVTRLKKNPNMNPSQQVTLSMEEARLLRDLLNRPEMAQYLEQ